MSAWIQDRDDPRTRHTCSASPRRLLGAFRSLFLTELVYHLLADFLAGNGFVMQGFLCGCHGFCWVYVRKRVEMSWEIRCWCVTA